MNVISLTENLMRENIQDVYKRQENYKVPGRFTDEAHKYHLSYICMYKQLTG